ncbi:MAG: hypothetical protein GX444_21120 [Myxococcales bacterium]|nr:hypothetical protein [Myxococcales bacterium]
MKFKSISVLAMILAFALLAGCANTGNNATSAPAKKYTDSEVVAWVNDQPIPKEQLEKVVAEAPEYIQAQLKTEAGKRNMVDTMVQAELVYQKAVQEGYLNKPEVQAKLDMVKKQVVVGEYLQGLIKAAIKQPTDEELRKFYDSNPQMAKMDFEQVKGMIAQRLTQQQQMEEYNKIVNQLKTTAKIKINEQNLGPFAPEAPQPQMPGMMGGEGMMAPEGAPAAPAAPAPAKPEDKAPAKK